MAPHPRSEQIWNYWTRTEAAWRERRPESYSTFDQWHEDALKSGPSHAGTELEQMPADLGPKAPPPDRLPALVSQYIEWEAFAFWARLIAEDHPTIPADVVAVIEQRCPGFLAHVDNQRTTQVEYSTWFWRELLSWIESHIFGAHKEKSWLDTIRDAARTHLRGERIAAYWAFCSSQWRKIPLASNPSFEQWLQDADAFVASHLQSPHD